MPGAPRVFFLPGAAGDGDHWRPVGQELPATWTKLYLHWPGLGNQPADPSVGGFDDLAARVVAALDRPGDLVAHSMGAIVAIRVALRHPRKVRRLVLCATSGGLDMVRHGAADWRPDYRREFPGAAAWVSQPTPDHTGELALISAPTLLIWSDADPLSPVSVGRHLASLLPDAALEVIPGATHSLAVDRPAMVARLLRGHLGRPGTPGTPGTAGTASPHLPGGKFGVP